LLFELTEMEQEAKLSVG